MKLEEIFQKNIKIGLYFFQNILYTKWVMEPKRLILIEN